MSIGEREKDIIQIILRHKIITISKIANEVQLSNKTVSESLKKIENAFKHENVSLVRKQNLGVFIEGDKKTVLELLTRSNENVIPNSKNERIQYLCFYILTREDYFTIQELSEILYISKTTIEKDMQSVLNIFEHFNVSIEKINGKGSFINLMEQEKRRLAIDLIYYFWGNNWEITEKNGNYLSNIKGIPDFVSSFIDMSSISDISEVVQRFLADTHLNLSDISFQALVLHISIAIERIRIGHYLEFSAQEPDRANNKFGTKRLIEQLEETFAVRIPRTEIENINIHFEMNYLQQKGENRVQATADMDEVIVTIINQVIPSCDDKTLQGLLNHLESAVIRMKNGLSILNPFTKDVKNNFPISFEEAVEMKKKLDRHFDIQLPEQEVAYIAVHIQAFKERQKGEIRQKVTALLVCSSGKGTSQLLAARLRRSFPEISISRIVSVQKLIGAEIHEDLVISTVPLTIETKKVLNVSPILNQQEIAEIGLAIQAHQISQEKQRNKEFSKLIHKEFLFLDKKFTSPEQVIEFIGQKLIAKGFTSEGIIQSALERELMAGTSFGNTATPHGAPKYVNRSVIVFLRLSDEIIWGTTKVRNVFFICIKDEDSYTLERIYDDLLEIIDDSNKRILRDGNQDNILMFMKEGL